MKRQATGALGVFEYLDDAVEAARKLREQGLPVQAMSPTLYHELQAVTDPGPSSLRWITLLGAVLGIAGGLSLCIWTALDWPLVTGGKEIVSLAPFFVPTFESMVLIGSLFNFVAMLVMARLPRWIADEGYDRRFTQDRIGLWVAAPVDRAEQVASLMRAEGAEEARVATG